MIYDVAVVGAGPAGSTLARLLAGSGQSLLLINGQGDGPGKPCGGLLAPDAQKILARFDLTLPKRILVDPQIFSVKTLDLASGLVRYYPRHYLNMDRRAFDQWLLSLVPASVARLDGRCLSAQRAADGLFELSVRTADGLTGVRCRQLVGADGAGSLVRRSFFADNIQRYVAIQQWFPARDMRPFYSCIFDPATSESCSWSINKDDAFIFGGCFAPQDCRAAFEQQKQRLEQQFGFQFGQPARSEACLALRPRRPSDFCLSADGAWLVGEAAGLISPSSFEGISSAILSGSLLAQALSSPGDRRSQQRRYARLTAPLRAKLLRKTLKRWFMYTPLPRRLIMRSGLSSVDPLLSE